MMYQRRRWIVRNEIKEIMQIDIPLINIVERKQLMWYGHMRRMNHGKSKDENLQIEEKGEDHEKA